MGAVIKVEDDETSFRHSGILVGDPCASFVRVKLFVGISRVRKLTLVPESSRLEVWGTV